MVSRRKGHGNMRHMGYRPKIKALNDNYDFLLYDWLSGICKTKYDWKFNNMNNEEFPSRVIESILYYHGIGLMFNSDKYGIAWGKYQPWGVLNIYGEFDRVKPTFLNGEQNVDLPRGEVVIVRDTLRETPLERYVHNYTSQIGQIHSIQLINTMAQLTPVILECDDKTVNSINQIWASMSSGAPAIAVARQNGLNVDNIKAHSTNAKFLANEIETYRQSIFSELLNLLGIRSMGFEKRERMNTIESSADTELVTISTDEGLLQRRMACEQINEKWNLGASVDFSESFKIVRDSLLSAMEKEGEINEPLAPVE